MFPFIREKTNPRPGTSFPAPLSGVVMANSGSYGPTVRISISLRANRKEIAMDRKQKYSKYESYQKFANLIMTHQYNVRHAFPGFLSLLLGALLLAGCQNTTNQNKNNKPSLGLSPTNHPYYGNPQWGSNNWILFGYTPEDSNGNPVIDSAGIYLMKYGSGKMELFHQGADIITYRWSPDAKWIVASYGSRQIIKISFPDKKIIPLTDTLDPFVVYPSMSPDAKTVVYTVDHPKETEGLWIVSADGQKVLHLLFHQFPLPNYTDWSPVNGREIATVTFTNMEGHVNLVILDTLTRQIHTIAHNEAGIRDPVFSPDGQKLLYWTHPTNNGDGQVWVVNKDGTHLKQLTSNGGWEPCWSPDGKYILYVRFSYIHTHQYGNGKLWIMHADGSDKHIFAD